MAKFEIQGYDSYSGCDILVTARLSFLFGSKKELKEKIYSLGSLQTLSVSTHQDKKPVRAIGSVNALDYTMGQRTIAGSLVFAVFDQHFASEMFKDLEEATGKTFMLPDELPAMDITISFANEYGRTSRMAIYGLRIINEGQVMSINDLYTENTYQFVATAMEPLRKGIVSGSSSNQNNIIHIESSKDNNTNNSIIKGEDIYNKLENNNLGKGRRITLESQVEQPLLLNQDGIVKLTISPSQQFGSISIFNNHNEKAIKEVNINEYISNQYTVLLSPGNYSAYYHNNGQTLSNTTIFNIIEVRQLDMLFNNTPTIEDVTEESINIISNSPSHTIAVCTNKKTGESFELDLISKKIAFKELTVNTVYDIYTKSDYELGESIKVKTLSPEENYIENYKSYVRYNKNLLFNSLEEYEPLLTSIKSNNIINDLSKINDAKAKELIFIAVKFKNEFVATINSHKSNEMPYKNLDNIYGDSFCFNSSTEKANIFSNKNNKEYFDTVIQQPIGIDYAGKANTAYSVVSIIKDFIKSPKYTFYSFADNDKYDLSNFKNSNVLNSYDTSTYSTINYKLTEETVKALIALENKSQDLTLLNAPNAILDNNLLLTIDINYKDIIGQRGNTYYICISKLEECLDSTPFRKVKILDTDNKITLDKYLTGICSDFLYCIWIEDANFNVISKLGFVNDVLKDNQINPYLISNELDYITKKIEKQIVIQNGLLDVLLLTKAETIGVKDIYNEYAENIINVKEDPFYIVKELYQLKFDNYYINKNKYNKVSYNKQSQLLNFNVTDKSQLIHIAFKKDSDVEINVYDSTSIVLTNNNDINLYYLIATNPIIKSGFIIANKNNIDSYLIDIEMEEK